MKATVVLVVDGRKIPLRLTWGTREMRLACEGVETHGLRDGGTCDLWIDPLMATATSAMAHLRVLINEQECA